MSEHVVDEVAFSDYLSALDRLERAARALRTAEPDAAAQHYLPMATEAFGLIFGFVGANMTARHVSKLNTTVAELEAVKDRASRPRQGDESP